MTETEEKTSKIPFLEVFSIYSKDNSSTLTGLGIVATITALFLNLSSNEFPNGLKELQVLLLILLIFSLIFTVINTAFWIQKNADSYFGGLVVCTLLIFLYKVLIFVINNFRQELKAYLLLMFAGVGLAVFFFFNDLNTKYQSKIAGLDPKLKGPLFALGIYVFLYVFNTCILLYGDFVKNLSFDWRDVTVNIFDPLILILTILVGIQSSFGPYIKIQERRKFWLVIFFAPYMFLIPFLLIKILPLTWVAWIVKTMHLL
jgi:hypothetical protein